MTPQTAGELLDKMRATNPLVHCITNYVAMNFSANVLLAAGASPAMIHSPEESGDFAAIASALTVNIGTLSPHWVNGMTLAAKAANAAGKPWILDPVAHFASPYRAGAAKDLLALKPTVLRGNASEVLALGGGESGGQGVDAGDPVAAAESTARSIAGQTGGVVAVTGEIDYVTDGSRAVRVTGGSALMPQVTATGCALTCLTGAYLAVHDDPLEATAAAFALFAAAGETAAKAAAGPGSFAVQFLDALSAVTADDVSSSGRISPA